jgi:hypothetical protein
VATCILIEEVARVRASSSLIPAVNKLGTMPVIISGSEPLKSQVLPDIAQGASACYALSEREAGSDTASMRTRARQDGSHWILNGTKSWITNAGEATWYTVMAVTDPDASRKADGISAFAVHGDDPGFEIGPKERKLGIRGSAQAVREAHQRFPGHAVHAGRHGYEGGSCQAAGYLAAARADRGEPGLGFISSAAKCFASDVAMEVTTNAVQVFGGAGYPRDFPVERMMRDAKITQIYEGTNQIQRVVMARQLLKG